MKKNNLVIGILFLLGGLALAILVLLLHSKLDNLLCSFSGAGIGTGLVMICKYFYWNAPQNRERYEEKLAEEDIELHDELNITLRERSGRYAYLLGLLVVSISIVVFSILGKLDIIHYARPIVLFLGGYLVFQYVSGIAIFRYLLKKY
ncbi:MAG: hypothetical protein Q4F79_04545 [Eubacteriales bacterium]|nr:hypothetical protein [Eubacteriales bacterium]